MRFMILVRALPISESGVMPTDDLIAQQLAFHQEIDEAGVLIDVTGFHPTSKAWRVLQRRRVPRGDRGTVPRRPPDRRLHIPVSRLVRELTEPAGLFSFTDPTDVELKGLSGMHALSAVRWRVPSARVDPKMVGDERR
jgi:hypothetical protein